MILTKISPAKSQQLSLRGWTKTDVDALVNGAAVRVCSATNRSSGNPATAYFCADGHYVVRDDVSGELVQISDRQRSIGYASGQWAPDDSIVDPLVP